MVYTVFCLAAPTALLATSAFAYLQRRTQPAPEYVQWISIERGDGGEVTITNHIELSPATVAERILRDTV